MGGKQSPHGTRSFTSLEQGGRRKGLGTCNDLLTETPERAIQLLNSNVLTRHDTSLSDIQQYFENLVVMYVTCTHQKAEI